MKTPTQPPSPRHIPSESPTTTLETNQPQEQISDQIKRNVVYMISQCFGNGKKEVPTLIFSYLEIFELLRLKTTNKAFQMWVRDYLEQLQFLDLSPYFGYTTSESRILDPTFSNGRSFFHVFQELCPHRNNLSLAYSTQLTCSALKHFLLPDNWSDKLVGLNLYYCTKLKRQELCELLCTFAPDLIDLNISMLYKLSAVDIQHLLHSLKNLKRLSIQGSLKLSSSDLPIDNTFESQTLEKLESEIDRKSFGQLLLIDCRNCTLLENRDFWKPSRDQDSNNQKMYGIFLRGSTWILGPKFVSLKDVQQILCLYQDCEAANSKFARHCKKCRRRLFLSDFLQKPSLLCVNQLQGKPIQKLSRKTSPMVH